MVLTSSQLISVQEMQMESLFRHHFVSTFWKSALKRLPGFPIVLHGSSSVPQEFVKMINQYGGNMPDAIGIPEDQLREAAKLAVCKINIDSDIRLAMTGNYPSSTLLSIRITSIRDSI